MNAQVAVAAAVAGIGAYTYYRNTNKPVFATFGPRKLELQSAELINHNTKRLRFALPDASQPSGLALTSALVAFSFPNGGWVPAPRPYTPTSDIGTYDPTFSLTPGTPSTPTFAWVLLTVSPQINPGLSSSWLSSIPAARAAVISTP